METAPEIIPVEKDYSNIKFAYVSINDVLKAMKLSYRGSLLYARRTKPMVNSTFVFLVSLMVDSDKEYTNDYIRKCLMLNHISQVSLARKKHKEYWESSERYRFRIDMAVRNLQRRNESKKKMLVAAVGSG